MSRERSDITRTIDCELQRARMLVDLVGHIDLVNPPDKGTLVGAMFLAREAIDHVQELLDWCEVRELPLLDDEHDAHDAMESREGE